MHVDRRTTIKSLAVGTLTSLATERDSNAANIIELEQIERWGQTHDRVWLGGEFWSNPMEDWRIQDGCVWIKLSSKY